MRLPYMVNVVTANRDFYYKVYFEIHLDELAEDLQWKSADEIKAYLEDNLKRFIVVY